MKPSQRICPDTDHKLTEFYKIKNGYTNSTERFSFSLEIHKCDPSTNLECEDDAAITEVF